MFLSSLLSLAPPLFLELKNSLTAAMFSCGLILATPVVAMEVRVTPVSPRLGDTISVIIDSDTPGNEPTVSVRQQTYPVFPLDANRDRYRALVPTTPLDKPGKLAISITADSQTQNIGVWLGDRSFPTQRIRLSGRSSQGATQVELDRVKEFKKVSKPPKNYGMASSVVPI